MSSSVPRAVVEAFYHALSIRDMGIPPFLTIDCMDHQRN